jgi:hypothetical protein
MDQSTVGQTADNLTSAKMGLELMSELIDRRQQEPDEAGFTEIVRLIGASRGEGDAGGEYRVDRSLLANR